MKPAEILGRRYRVRTCDPLIKRHRKSVKNQRSFRFFTPKHPNGKLRVTSDCRNAIFGSAAA